MSAWTVEFSSSKIELQGIDKIIIREEFVYSIVH